jgi:hypothetical protein
MLAAHLRTDRNAAVYATYIGSGSVTPWHAMVEGHYGRVAG